MLALFDSKGFIAAEEGVLIIQATLMMLVVVVPVLVLLFYFAWHYRASNKNARYMPNWEHSKMDELVWWAIPFEIILVLSALTWSSTHALDPRKPLESNVAPITVQVVALPWKWLFIYPELGVASVNTLHIPTDTPINFKITADAPMNSFWIPELGGQIYAMTGMVTELHLIANESGTFKGLSANYSGEGFADMTFNVHANPKEAFDLWVAQTRQSSAALDSPAYALLAKPSTMTEAGYYGSVAPIIFDSLLMRFAH